MTSQPDVTTAVRDTSYTVIARREGRLWCLRFDVPYTEARGGRAVTQCRFLWQAEGVARDWLRISEVPDADAATIVVLRDYSGSLVAGLAERLHLRRW